jgi:hypothetical protein
MAHYETETNTKKRKPVFVTKEADALRLAYNQVSYDTGAPVPVAGSSLINAWCTRAFPAAPWVPCCCCGITSIARESQGAALWSLLSKVSDGGAGGTTALAVAAGCPPPPIKADEPSAAPAAIARVELRMLAWLMLRGGPEGEGIRR